MDHQTRRLDTFLLLAWLLATTYFLRILAYKRSGFQNAKSDGEHPGLIKLFCNKLIRYFFLPWSLPEGLILSHPHLEIHPFSFSWLEDQGFHLYHSLFDHHWCLLSCQQFLHQWSLQVPNLVCYQQLHQGSLQVTRQNEDQKVNDIDEILGLRINLMFQDESEKEEDPLEGIFEGWGFLLRSLWGFTPLEMARFCLKKQDP